MAVNTLVRTRDLARALSLEPVYDVAVIMVVYNTGPVLFETIEKVVADPAVDEFIIVNNGSSDADYERLLDFRDDHPKVQLISGHGNVGFGVGCNIGASASRSEWLIFLNPDAYLQPGTVDRLVDAAKDRPSPCIVGARVLHPDGTEQRGGRRGEVTPFTTLVTLSRLTKLSFLKHFDIHKENEPLPTTVVPTPVISGSCFCVGRRDFRALKGFDPKFFLHVEDIDICWRARQMGGVVLFAPRAEVRHVGHTSHVAPLFVEWHKGLGLIRYFFKRSWDLPHFLVTVILAPAIMMAAVLRPTLRRLRLRLFGTL